MKALNTLFLTQSGRPILPPFSQALLLPLVLAEQATVVVVLVRPELLVLLSLLRLFLYRIWQKKSAQRLMSQFVSCKRCPEPLQPEASDLDAPMPPLFIFFGYCLG